MKRCILFFALLFSLACYGQSPSNVERIDGTVISTTTMEAAINRMTTAAKVNGMQIAIINDNKVVYRQAFGFKDKANNAVLDTSTIMYAASFSEAVFAYINMRLVQKGLIDLDAWADCICVKKSALTMRSTSEPSGSRPSESAL